MVRLQVDPPKDQKTDNEYCYMPKRLIHTWSGHTKGVNAIRFFPNTGHLLLSAGLDGKIKIWDVMGAGKCMRTYMGFTKVGCASSSLFTDVVHSLLHCMLRQMIMVDVHVAGQDGGLSLYCFVQPHCLDLDIHMCCLPHLQLSTAGCLSCPLPAALRCHHLP